MQYRNFIAMSLECYIVKQASPIPSVIPGWLLGLIFAGCVPLASQNPFPIIVYSVAKYRPHLGQFWENVIFAIQTLNYLRTFFMKPFN